MKIFFRNRLKIPGEYRKKEGGIKGIFSKNEKNFPKILDKIHFL